MKGINGKSLIGVHVLCSPFSKKKLFFFFLSTSSNATFSIYLLLVLIARTVYAERSTGDTSPGKPENE